MTARLSPVDGFPSWYLTIGFGVAAALLATALASADSPRLKQGAVDAYGLYRVPYGIDRGSCDRAAVAREVTAGKPATVTNAAAGIAPTQERIGATMTIAGGVGSAMVGNAIGRTMDAIDHHCVGRVLEYAPDRRGIVWRNADSGLDYTVMAIRTYVGAAGAYCRDYQATAMIEGRLQAHQVSACRQPDGSWRTVD